MHFAEAADFRSLHAEEGFILGKCRFDKDFLFRGSTVNKKWEADSTRFDGLLDLSKAKLHDFVYLESIQQGTEQRFAFHNTVAERLLLRIDQLDRLASERAGQYAEAMAEYGLLKRASRGCTAMTRKTGPSTDSRSTSDGAAQGRLVASAMERAGTVLRLAAPGPRLRLRHEPIAPVVAALVMILVFAMVYMIGVNSMHVNHAAVRRPGRQYPQPDHDRPHHERRRVHIGLRRPARRGDRWAHERLPDRRIPAGYAPVGAVHRRLQPQGHPMNV